MHNGSRKICAYQIYFYSAVTQKGIHSYLKERFPPKNKQKDIVNILRNKTQFYSIECTLGVGMTVVKQLAWRFPLGCYVGNISNIWCSETISGGAGLSWCCTIGVSACISISCMKRLEQKNYSKSKRKA